MDAKLMLLAALAVATLLLGCSSESSGGMPAAVTPSTAFPSSASTSDPPLPSVISSNPPPMTVDPAVADKRKIAVARFVDLMDEFNRCDEDPECNIGIEPISPETIQLYMDTLPNMDPLRAGNIAQMDRNWMLFRKWMSPLADAAWRIKGADLQTYVTEVSMSSFQWEECFWDLPSSIDSEGNTIGVEGSAYSSCAAEFDRLRLALEDLFYLVRD